MALLVINTSAVPKTKVSPIFNQSAIGDFKLAYLLTGSLTHSFTHLRIHSFVHLLEIIMTVDGVLYVPKKPAHNFRKSNIRGKKQSECILSRDELKEMRDQPKFVCRIAGKELRL